MTDILKNRHPDKVMIYWLRARARKPKMQGLATAEGSACIIQHFRNMAARREGRCYIVEAPTAAAGREIIREYRETGKAPMAYVESEKRFVVIGARAVAAVCGSAEAIRLWEARRLAQGRVHASQTRALEPNRFRELDPVSLKNLFGGKSDGS